MAVDFRRYTVMGVDICPIIPIDIKPGHAHFKQVDGYLQSTLRNIYVDQCTVQIGLNEFNPIYNFIGGLACICKPTDTCHLWNLN